MVLYALYIDGEPHSIERLIIRPDPPDGGEPLPLAA